MTDLSSQHILKTPTTYEGLYRDKFNVLDESLWDNLWDKDHFVEIRGTRKKLILRNKKIWYALRKPKT